MKTKIMADFQICISITLSRGIYMEIPNLIKVQKGHLVAKKNGNNLLKNVLLKLNFPHDGHLYANRFVYILTVYCKYLLFQF